MTERKPEQRLWDRMSRNVGRDPEIWLQRMENMVGSGFPDVHAISRGIVTGVELKQADVIPVGRDTKLLKKGMRLDQRNWHLDCERHGARSCVLIGVASDLHILVPGRLADKINEASLMKLMNMAIIAHRGPEFWTMFRLYLKGRI